MRLGDIPARSILRLPPDAPVRRLAVQLAAREAGRETTHVCECGEKYLAAGVPPTFHDARYGEQRFLCRNPRCRRVL